MLAPVLRAGKFWFAALAVVAVAACTPTSQTNPTAGPAAAAKPTAPAANIPPSSPVAAKEALTIKLVVPHQTGFDVVMPMHVGVAKGFFAEEGLTIDPIYSKGGADTIQALTSGDADLGLANGPLGIYGAFSKNAPLVIISSEIYGAPDVFFFAKGDSAINGIKDLAGKKVGFSSRGSSTNLLVLSIADMVKQQGLAPLEAVPAGSPPDNLVAVKTGQIDVGWASPPTFQDMLDKGEIKIVARGSDVAALKDITVRANVATRAFVDKHPAAATGFLRAYQKAVDYAYANKNEAVTIWKERAQIKDSEATLLKVFDFYPKDTIRVGAMKGIDRNNELAVQFGLLKEPLTKQQLDQLISTKYLPNP